MPTVLSQPGVSPTGGGSSDYASVPTRDSLLRRLRDLGDQPSWESFFETYWRLIYSVARSSGLADADAQDVVQETVIAVARRIPEFRYDPARGSFKQWLLLITRRRIHDHLRAAYRAARNSQAAAEDACVAPRAAGAQASPSPDALVDASWESEWRARMFEMAIDRVRHRVNPKQFQAFDFCVRQNMPVSEAGRLLGLNPAQIYLAKHRVSQAVKRAVAELTNGAGGLK